MQIKAVLFLSAFLTFGGALGAQDLALGIYPLRDAGQLSAAQRQTVESKIKSLLTGNNLTAADSRAPVGIRAEWVQYEPKTADAGLRKVTVIEAELVFVAQQNGGGATFGAYRKKLTGSGTDARQAQNGLLAAIPSKDAGFDRFIAEVRPKIEQYFAEHCAEILADADKAANTGNLQQAISSLYNIPAGSSCRAGADAKLTALYNRNRDNLCNKYLSQARAAAAVKNYPRTAELLGYIDPEAACAKEAGAFIDELGKQADADFKAKLDTLSKWLSARTELEKFRHGLLQDYLIRQFN